MKRLITKIRVGIAVLWFSIRVIANAIVTANRRRRNGDKNGNEKKSKADTDYVSDLPFVMIDENGYFLVGNIERNLPDSDLNIIWVDTNDDFNKDFKAMRKAYNKAIMSVEDTQPIELNRPYHSRIKHCTDDKHNTTRG